MEAEGVRLIRHYRDMAFMGFIPVLLHAKTILGNIKACKEAIKEFIPDILILVDYPSFNLKMAQFVKENMSDVTVYYYISPKLWAWKEYRLKSMKRYVDKIFSILPFEVDWFSERGLEVEYVGNPCVDAIENRAHKNESRTDFEERTGVDSRPILALLAGSRVQEVKSSLPIMLDSASQYKDYQVVVAGVKSIDSALYRNIMKGYDAKVVYNETYELLQQSEIAVVTSGTATLETALMRVPEVVVYKMSGGWLFHRFLELFIRVPYISLVNLIAQKWLVQELVIEEFTAERLSKEIDKLRNEEYRKNMLQGYDDLIALLGKDSVSDRAAHAMLSQYNQSKNSSI